MQQRPKEAAVMAAEVLAQIAADPAQPAGGCLFVGEASEVSIDWEGPPIGKRGFRRGFALRLV